MYLSPTMTVHISFSHVSTNADYSNRKPSKNVGPGLDPDQLGLTADNSIIKHFETISGLTKSRARSKLFGVRPHDNNWSMPIE